jgi:hypothetical protein
MTNQSENSHILFTGPGGWNYWAWSEDGRLPSKDIETLSEELNIDVDKEKLLDGDDVESFREFVHVIVELAKKYGFTHLVDREMDILIDQPKPIIQVINESLQNGGWTTGAQLRVLKGLDISHLGS